ncbi:MAG: hypothetical protein HZA02_05870 [Nitrospinae bacterium]|nr:hypothetical protein [Nitrospinota bacterium]
MLENIIFRAKSVLYKKYWQAGFATRLYDLLAKEELCAEVRSAGFEVHRSGPVYANSACLVTAKPVC